MNFVGKIFKNNERDTKEHNKFMTVHIKYKHAKPKKYNNCRYCKQFVMRRDDVHHIYSVLSKGPQNLMTSS